MTLDEAIEHYEELSHKTGALQEGHRQLADWLTDLRMRREGEPPDPDTLFPYGPDFVRADVYRETMKEYCEWIGKAADLVRVLLYCMSDECDCDQCAVNGKEMPTFTVTSCDCLYERVRDFGIEVGK